MSDSELRGRAPRESETQMTELVLPQHANAVGTAFGGTVVGWVDICAAIAAQRHAGRVAVTASIDALEFHAPIRVGDLVCLSARVNAVFRSSLEVSVHVEREDRVTRARTLCVHAFLTFVGVDDGGQPTPIPPLSLETDEDRERDRAARSRRDDRLARRKKDP
jgi:acyl-CoA hydrolase